MGTLHISILGTFHVTQDGKAVTGFDSDKARALLAYLAIEADRPHRREKLAGLFWPEQTDKRARANLSQVLFSLRKAIGDREAEPPFLRINPKAIPVPAEMLLAMVVWRPFEKQLIIMPVVLLPNSILTVSALAFVNHESLTTKPSAVASSDKLPLVNPTESNTIQFSIHTLFAAPSKTIPPTTSTVSL